MESFFENLPVATDIISKEYQDYFPQTPLLKGEQIQFEIPPSYNQLTDPQVMLYVDGYVENADHTGVPQTVKVALQNSFFHAMFENVCVKLNTQTVYNANNLYPYKAYIETLYTYSEAGKRNFNQLEIYKKEQPNKFSNFDDDNPSYVWRRGKTVSPTTPALTFNVVRMAGRLHADLFLQNRPLIPGVGISVILKESDDKFRLMCNEAGVKTQTFTIKKIFIRIFRINLNPNVLLNIERALISQPATYYLSRVVIRPHQIPKGTSQLSNYIVNNGPIPKYVILTTISSKSQQGDYAVNPFIFNLKKTKFCQLNVNGAVYPSKPYDVSEDVWIDPYINLLKVVNKFYVDSDIDVDLSDLTDGEGYQVLAFDLTGNLAGTSGGRHTPLKNGILRLDMEFHQAAVTESTNLLFYMVFDSVLQIDARKNVIMNYIAL